VISSAIHKIRPGCRTVFFFKHRYCQRAKLARVAERNKVMKSQNPKSTNYTPDHWIRQLVEPRRFLVQFPGVGLSSHWLLLCCFDHSKHNGCINNNRKKQTFQTESVRVTQKRNYNRCDLKELECLLKILY